MPRILGRSNNDKRDAASALDRLHEQLIDHRMRLREFTSAQAAPAGEAVERPPSARRLSRIFDAWQQMIGDQS